MILLETSLSRLEKKIFLNLASFEGMTFSCAVKQLPYSESSAKAVIRRLKAKQLIECGDRSNTNIPLFLTNFGRKIFSVLSNNLHSSNKRTSLLKFSDSRWQQKVF